MEAVWDFWSGTNKEHTFHFPPAWPETQVGIQFYAWRKQRPGTEAVWDFWNEDLKQHTFHFMPAQPNEKPMNIQFFAHRLNPRAAVHGTAAFLAAIAAALTAGYYFCVCKHLKDARRDITG